MIIVIFEQMYSFLFEERKIDWYKDELELNLYYDHEIIAKYAPDKKTKLQPTTIFNKK